MFITALKGAQFAFKICELFGKFRVFGQPAAAPQGEQEKNADNDDRGVDDILNGKLKN